MTEEAKPVAVLPKTMASCEVTINKDDVINAKFSNVEIELYKKTKEAEKAQAKEKREKEKTEADLRKLLQVGTDVTPPVLEPLEAVYKALGEETKGGCARSLCEVSRDEVVKLSDDSELNWEDDEAPQPHYISEVGFVLYRRPLSDEDTHRASWTKPYERPTYRALSAAEQAELDKILGHEKRIGELMEELRVFARQKSELPMRKRMAAAAMVNEIVKATAEGQAMADAIGMDEVDMPLLEE
jgi:hypothetical protein